MNDAILIEVDDDSGDDGFGVELYYNIDDKTVGISTYSDIGHGSCYFSGERLKEVVGALSKIVEAAQKNMEESQAQQPTGKVQNADK